jgi:1,4-alpha-glucan branching enzyme
MEETGYLLLVLNTHMPFLRHPEELPPPEESWLFEAITECYIPLLEKFDGLVRDGANFKITLSLSPTLISMLADDLLQSRYVHYIEKRISLTERESERLQNEPALRRLSFHYREQFIRTRDAYLYKWNRNLVHAFGRLLDSGKVDLITSAATHAFLPLWELYPQTVKLQIRLAVELYKNYFQRCPLGFWLPECGFYPGVDYMLAEEGIKYFFLDSHGIWRGNPRPKYGAHVPIHTPAGVAAFGRDWDVHKMAWSKDTGYPGDPFYLDIDRDIGFEIDPDYLTPFSGGHRYVPTGITYLCKGESGYGEPYDPDRAFSRCNTHANHFVHMCQQLVTQLRHALGKKPVLVGLFDTEHFGHWWREGPTWLDLVLRKLAYDQQTVKLITARDYLGLHPTNQVVTLSMSSWGYWGYCEPWLMGRNHWIYPPLFRSIEVLEELLRSNPLPEGEHRVLINQYLRELLLAQSSDWAYILHAQTAVAYAESRLRQHMGAMDDLAEQFRWKQIDYEMLNRLRHRNNIFSDVDLLGLYKQTHNRR